MTVSSKMYQTQDFPVQATVKFRICCGRGFNIYQMHGFYSNKTHGSLEQTP